MLQEIQNKTNESMESAIRSFTVDLKRVRTGRASITLLDPVKVMYYGTLTPVAQVASVSIPEADLIMIQPWDTGILNEIMKAIQKADLGINPNNDGKVIRLKLPPMTEERRKELVKQIKKLGEEAKVSIRSHRQHANDAIKKLVKGKEISEDDSKHGQDQIQKLTDDHVKKIDHLLAEKEKEIMSF